MIASIFNYIAFVVASTIAQLVAVFGGVFGLALLMHAVSSRIRGIGSRRIGMLYYYIVAPGVACHELGHAAGCLLTGTKIYKIKLFAPSGDSLGYVSHAAHGKNSIRRVSYFIIATGPIWFGCCMIALLSSLLLGKEAFHALVDNCDIGAARGLAGLAAYAASLVKNAILVAFAALLPWNWQSPFSILYIYLIFCIASEITMSSADFRIAVPGFAAIAALCFLTNLFTGGALWTKIGFSSIMACQHVILSMMLFVIFVDFIFLIIIRALAKHV